MQNFVLHKKLYQLNKIDESSYSGIVYKRYEILRLYKKLRAEGTSEPTALEALEVTRSTFFRWAKRYKDLGLEGLEKQSRTPKAFRKPSWKGEKEKTVLNIRKKYPLFSKHKLAVMLKRESGKTISVSAIGRILKDLLAQGLIKPAMFHLMGKFPKKPRLFTGHAQRWKYHMRPTKPGEMVQVDHMTITLHGRAFKHFNAICPITKITVGQVYTDATSDTAAQFLKELCLVFPFALRSIQVDGGPEFMAAFEKGCERSGGSFVCPTS
jgi:putative transposase